MNLVIDILKRPHKLKHQKLKQIIQTYEFVTLCYKTYAATYILKSQSYNNKRN